jgi:hypothetical protein
VKYVSQSSSDVKSVFYENSPQITNIKTDIKLLNFYNKGLKLKSVSRVYDPCFRIKKMNSQLLFFFTLLFLSYDLGLEYVK